MNEASGQSEDLEHTLLGFQPRLRALVDLRLDRLLRDRLDPSDVLQEVMVDVSRRLPEYRKSPDMSFFMWVRFLTVQKLQEVHRRHLGAKQRDARREVRGALLGPEVSSVALSRVLVDGMDTPHAAAARGEELDQMEQALEELEPEDREILVLRHFEQLNNADSARVLGLSEAAASRRYTRAIERVKNLIVDETG